MKKINSKLILSFELHSLLRDVIRNIWLMILAALIALMGVYIAEKTVYKPEYTSTSTVVVRAKASTSGAYTNYSASSEMAKIFSDVFVQSSMKKLAANNLGAESFQGTLSAEVNGETNLITLSVTSASPMLSFKLLSSVLEVYPETSEDIFSNAVIDVIVAPQMPTSSSNAVNFSLKGQIAIVAAFAMAAAVVVLSLLRDTVKTQSMFEDCIESKLIGTITHENPHLSLRERFFRKKRALLINDAFATLKFSEDYQKIATKLEYMKQNGDSKIFAITSIAENEGKSTSAANIAIALAGRGHRVLIADFDFHKPSVYKIFECEDKIRVELGAVLSGECKPKDFNVIRHKKSNLFMALNRTGRKDSAKWIDSDIADRSFDVMRNNFDFIIVDTPPISVSADAVSIIEKSDKALLIVRTDCVLVPDINDTILSISEVTDKLVGCILNDVNKSFTLFGQMGVDESGYYGNKYGTYKSYAGYNRQLLNDEYFEDNVMFDSEDNR